MPVLVAAFLAALVAALGNALFSYGQRNAEAKASPMFLTTLTLFVATVLLGLFSVMQIPSNIGDYVKVNAKWLAFTGGGTAITYIGFYYLYQHGASYYVMYAMLALLTTAIGVGVFVMREQFNFYYGLAMVFAIATLVFFMLGQRQALLRP